MIYQSLIILKFQVAYHWMNQPRRTPRARRGHWKKYFFRDLCVLHGSKIENERLSNSSSHWQIACPFR